MGSMKKLVAIFFIFTTSAFAQSSTFFNSNGEYVGSYQSNGRSGSFFNGNSNYMGSTYPSGQNTVVFDRNGNYVGAIMNNNGLGEE